MTVTQVQTLREDATETARCRNCAAPLTGPYCAACGQRDLPPDPTLGDLLSEAWDTFVSLDGKVVRSVRLLLLHPGALTTEYLAGRRASFVPPLRLYLTCSVLYFLVGSLLPERAAEVVMPSVAGARDTSGDTIAHRVPRSVAGTSASARAGEGETRQLSRHDSLRLAVLDSLGSAVPAGERMDSATMALADSVLAERKIRRESAGNPSLVRRAIVRRLVRNAGAINRDRKTFGTRLREQGPRMMILLMPAFAALLALAYRSRRRRYPTHLVVSLHLHAFFFAGLTVYALCSLLPWKGVRGLLAVALGSWLATYLPLALRRVYGGRLRLAVLRAAVVAGVYSVIATVAVSAVAVLIILFY